MKSVKNASKQSPFKPQTLLQQLAQTPDKLFNGKSAAGRAGRAEESFKEYVKILKDVDRPQYKSPSPFIFENVEGLVRVR